MSASGLGPCENVETGGVRARRCHRSGPGGPIGRNLLRGHPEGAHGRSWAASCTSPGAGEGGGTYVTACGAIEPRVSAASSRGPARPPVREWRSSAVSASPPPATMRGRPGSRLGLPARAGYRLRRAITSPLSPVGPRTSGHHIRHRKQPTRQFPQAYPVLGLPISFWVRKRRQTESHLTFPAGASRLQPICWKARRGKCTVRDRTDTPR
jgi:hypothetical protein